MTRACCLSCLRARAYLCNTTTPLSPGGTCATQLQQHITGCTCATQPQQNITWVYLCNITITKYHLCNTTTYHLRYLYNTTNITWMCLYNYISLGCTTTYHQGVPNESNSCIALYLVKNYKLRVLYITNSKIFYKKNHHVR